ncbi:MAG: Crp/Fnr family transcriptional regulator [Myxococcota bacterium]
MDELADGERATLFERYGRTYEAGTVVYAEGEPADASFLIQEGRVRLMKEIRGAERSLTLLRPGDLFGEDALVPDAVRQATAMALSELTVLALDRRTLAALMAGNAEVALRVLAQLVRRLQYAEEQLENAMLGDHASRVVNTLIRLATATAAGSEGHVVTVSPLELASRVGLDVDTAKRAVQQLQDGGYVHIVGERLLVPDLDALRQLYDLLGRKEEVRGAVS